MRIRRMVISGSTHTLGATVLASCLLLIASQPLDGQTIGNNSVYNSSGTCSPNCAASSAFIDASVLLANALGTDLCDTLYGLFSGQRGFPPYPATGAVVDARGISGSALTCSKGSPWSESNNSVSPPSNVLLPAGTIVIPSMWVLPPNTHLTGQGDNPSSGTVIQACKSPQTTCSSGFAGTAIIQFGSSNCVATGCQAVSAEKLILDGNGQQITGILNQSSQGGWPTHFSATQIDPILGAPPFSAFFAERVGGENATRTNPAIPDLSQDRVQ